MFHFKQIIIFFHNKDLGKFKAVYCRPRESGDHAARWRSIGCDVSPAQSKSLFRHCRVNKIWKLRQLIDSFTLYS